MASKPLRTCNTPGCAELTRDSYCPEHKRVKQYQQYKDRPAHHALYNTTRWRRVRLLYLSGNPLCVKCKQDGVITPATVVDHVIDHKGDLMIFWDVTNWQSLCERCHNKKTGGTR